jgi:2-dehydropantoate 2-reductase
MRTTWVVGVGGIGAVVAYGLAHDGLDTVVAVDDWREHVEAMAARGLVLRGQFGDAPAAVHAVHVDDVSEATPAPDIVFLCSKSARTRSLAGLVEPHLGPSTPVVSLQNGLNVEVLAEVVGAARALGSVVLIDGGLEGPGVVRQERPNGFGEYGFVLGGPAPSSRGAATFAAEILSSVAPVRLTDEIEVELWSKLLRNCMFNAVCAISTLTVGATLRTPPITDVVLGLASEMVAVARASDIDLAPWSLFDLPADTWVDDRFAAPILERARDAYPAGQDLRPSMLQDVLKGRPTEVDFMNGWIAERAATLGLDAPLNAVVTELVHRIERTELAPGAGPLEGPGWAQRLAGGSVIHPS